MHAGVAELDPESPLSVRPPVDDPRYDRLLARELDDVRSRAVAAGHIAADPLDALVAASPAETALERLPPLRDRGYPAPPRQ